MSSEEELEGLEQSIQSTMTGYLVRRTALAAVAALMVAALEFGSVVLAIIGLANLHGWWILAGLLAILLPLGLRGARMAYNLRHKGRGERDRLVGVGLLLKTASLPINVVGYFAFAAWMPVPAAAASAIALMFVELGGWLFIAIHLRHGLKQVIDFAKDSGSPRTWEI